MSLFIDIVIILRIIYLMLRLNNLAAQLRTEETPQYKFTVDGGALTKQQRDFYEENGYIVLEGMFDLKDIDKWVSRFGDYVEKKAKPHIGM